MTLAKSALKTAIEDIFEDLGSSTASEKAQELADALDDYVKTALVEVSIPAGAVIVAVSGGTFNVNPINLLGDPDTPGGDDDEGGLT